MMRAIGTMKRGIEPDKEKGTDKDNDGETGCKRLRGDR